jgi:hypothetical protein
LVQMTNSAYGYTEGNPLSQIDPLGLFYINPVDQALAPMNNVNAMRNMSLSDWATVSGLVAAGVAIAASIVGGGAVIVAAVGIAAMTINVLATLETCENSGYGSFDCNWSMSGIGLSLIPFGKFTSGLAKSAAGSAFTTAKKQPLSAYELNGNKTGERFMHGGIQLLGPIADMTKRGIDYGEKQEKERKEKDEC